MASIFFLGYDKSIDIVESAVKDYLGESRNFERTFRLIEILPTQQERERFRTNIRTRVRDQGLDLKLESISVEPYFTIHEFSEALATLPGDPTTDDPLLLEKLFVK